MNCLEVFDQVYNSASWGNYRDNDDDEGSLSGGGSTRQVNRTRNLFLAFSILKLNVKYICDICGDCNWQRDFMKLLPDREYFGIDASEKALSIARSPDRLLPNMKITERACDMTKNCPEIKNPQETLFLIKEVVQHLPLELGVSLIKNIKSKGVRYIAITHHDPAIFQNANINHNIEISKFYENNMFIHPFNFKNPIFDIGDFLLDESKSGAGNLMVFDLQEQDI